MDTDTEEEKHEVEPFQAGIFTSSRNIRNPGSRVFHCCLIVPLLLILAFAITSLSYFAVMDEEVRDLKLEGSGKCVLFARWNKDTGYIDLNSSHACTFSIFGEVSVAVLAALLIVWMIVKTSAGFHMATMMVICEIPVLVLHVAFAFCVSVTISIGLAITCSEYKYEGRKGGCSNYTLPRPVTERNRYDVVFFYDHVNKSMVTSWLAVVVLFILLGMHVLLFIVYCVKRVRKSNHELLPVSDGESSSDGDSMDEAMVPIAELERR